MDKYTCSLLKALRSRSGVSNVKFDTEEPCSTAALSAWDRKCSPYTLPEDYKSFLLACNGLHLTWDLQFKGKRHEFGCLHVNGIEDVVNIPLDTYPPDDSDIHPQPDVFDGQCSICSAGLPVAAFDIDTTCQSGRCVLMYLKGQAEPQVWFQDLGCTWNYLAPTFTEYFRVLTMYRGIPGWQYSFTKYGLDPVTQRWVRFLCPERLCVRPDTSGAGEGDMEVEEVLLDESVLERRQSQGGKSLRGKVRRPGTASNPSTANTHAVGTSTARREVRGGKT